MNAVVITVSDSCSCGQREDRSGPEVAARLRHAGFTVNVVLIIPDEQEQIAQTLRQQATEAQLVVTTGGTGITARDCTPEATRSVCDRIVEGFGERMRSEGLKDTPLAPLSRAVTGTLGATLIVNVPGSPTAAVQSLEAVLPLIPHALALLSGHTGHPQDNHHPATPGDHTRVR
ncbi:MAG: MogA/MoaB family molybdenum cofactor biosynthesis protein [Acidobacteriaceae bacterium]